MFYSKNYDPDEKQTPAEQQPQSPAPYGPTTISGPYCHLCREPALSILKPHSPPPAGASTPTENVLNPVASPSVVGMYDFAWDESPAVRASPRNGAFNHRSTFLRRLRANSDDGSFSSRKRPRDDDAMTDSPPTRTRLDFDVGRRSANDATPRKPHKRARSAYKTVRKRLHRAASGPTASCSPFFFSCLGP